MRQYSLNMFQDKSKKWRIQLLAPNGRIVMSSEAYSEKYAMKRTVDSLAGNILDLNNVRLTEEGKEVE